MGKFRTNIAAIAGSSFVCCVQLKGVAAEGIELRKASAEVMLKNIGILEVDCVRLKSQIGG